MSKLTDIHLHSEEFDRFSRYIIDGINTGVINFGNPDDMYEHSDLIKSVAYDALAELLDRIYEVENRHVEGRE